MQKSTGRTASYMFIVRLWREELGGGMCEWRGEIKDVVNAQQRYFREWPALVDFIQSACYEVEQDGFDADMGSGVEPTHDGRREYQFSEATARE